MRIALAFALHFLLCGTMFAQNDRTIVVGDSTIQQHEAEISGQVFLTESNEPLPGVSIFVEELSKGTVTDSTGSYNLILPTGSHEIRFQYLGYRTIRRQVQLYSNGVLNIRMNERALSMEEVIVRGTTYENNVLNVVPGIESMSLGDIENLPTVMGEVNVINSLLTLPGVTNVGEGASGFNVRGGRTDQNLVLIEGTQLFNASHVLGLYSAFNPDITERFTLYKGHIPARFGGRLSSVLDVSMRNGSLTDYSLAGGVGIAAGRLLVEGPITKNKTSFLLSGRTSYSDWVLNLAKNTKLNRSSARFSDLNASIHHQINSNNSIKLYGYGSRDRMQYASDFGYAWSNKLINADWSSSLSDPIQSKLSFSFGNYSSTYFDPSGFDGFNLYHGINYLKVKENIFYEISDRHLFNTGFEWNRYNGLDEKLRPYADESSIEPENVEQDSGQEFSVYISDEFQLSNNLLLSAGFRYTYYQQLGPATIYSYHTSEPKTEFSIIDSTNYASGDIIKNDGGLEPRISARYSFTENSSVKLSYNKTSQYIHQVSNATSPTPADIWQVSDPYLPPQRANQYSVGFFKNFKNDIWETSLDFFYKDIQHLVEYKNFAELFLNPHLETELLDANGKSYGLELSIKKTLGEWKGWLSYAYTRTFAQVTSTNVQESLNNGEWFPSNYDRPHSITLIAERQLGEKSSFSANFTYTTGRPITAIESSYEDGETQIPIYSTRNEYRIPDYIRLDISFTIAENIWKHRTVDPDRPLTDSMTISFYNLLSRENAFSVFYKRAAFRTYPRPHKLSVIGAVIPSVTYNFKF